MEELVETGPVLASTRALTNEGGVGGEDDSLPHTAIPLATDLTIVELRGGGGGGGGKMCKDNAVGTVE